MRCQGLQGEGLLNRAHDVAAVVFSRQHQGPTQDGATEDIDDDQEPHAIDVDVRAFATRYGLICSQLSIQT